MTNTYPTDNIFEAAAYACYGIQFIDKMLVSDTTRKRVNFIYEADKVPTGLYYQDNMLVNPRVFHTEYMKLRRLASAMIDADKTEKTELTEKEKNHEQPECNSTIS